MVAVGTYALPDFSEEVRALRERNSASIAASFVEFFDTDLRKLTRPYTLLLGQWQQWPLFAPDPLRRVVSFSIEAELPGGWSTVRTVSPEALPWWKKAAHLKTIRRLEEREKYERYAPVRAAYAREACRSEHLPPDTPVRLRIDRFVIPKDTVPQTAAWWRMWRPQWQSAIDLETRCPLSPA